jgi:hypothetical protein
LLRKKIVINSNFNVVGVVPNRNEIITKEWIDYRMELFMKYTMKSFKNQTNQNFIYLLKYDESTEELINNALGKYESLPDNIQFVTGDLFKKKILEDIDNYDYVYLTRIDADDMLRIDYVNQLYDYSPKEGTAVLINQNGYIYDSNKNNILKISYLCPPFYTLVYASQVIKKKINNYAIAAGHIPYYNLPHELMAEYNYIWHIHGKNTLNPYRRFCDGYGLDIDMNNLIKDESSVNEILKSFIG